MNHNYHNYVDAFLYILGDRGACHRFDGAPYDYIQESQTPIDSVAQDEQDKSDCEKFILEHFSAVNLFGFYPKVLLYVKRFSVQSSLQCVSCGRPSIFRFHVYRAV